MSFEKYASTITHEEFSEPPTCRSPDGEMEKWWNENEVGTEKMNVNHYILQSRNVAHRIRFHSLLHGKNLKIKASHFCHVRTKTERMLVRGISLAISQ